MQMINVSPMRETNERLAIFQQPPNYLFPAPVAEVEDVLEQVAPEILTEANTAVPQCPSCASLNEKEGQIEHLSHENAQLKSENEKLRKYQEKYLELKASLRNLIIVDYSDEEDETDDYASVSDISESMECEEFKGHEV